MDIIKILQREIHDWKVKWGELKEQNVSLQGFKKMVMEKPADYVDWKQKCQELENEMILIKGITVTNSPELRAEQKKVKELEDRLAEVLSIEDEHQKLNGKLNMRVAELEEFNIKVRQEVTIKEQEILELHADNKKLATQVEDSVDRMRKAGIL